jgi:nicotinamide mononucleotide transporter
MAAVTSAFVWLKLHYPEVIAVISGLLYVILTIRENSWLWFFGIVSSGLYAWIFFKSSIHAYAILYIYYVGIGFYGWYNWTRKSADTETGKNNLTIHRATARHLLACLVSTFVLIIPLFFILKKFSASGMALADAVLTSGGMVATWMLTQKLLEQWLFWIIIDLLSMGVMIYKELYPSAFLFLIYTLLAVKGFLEWKKELKAQAAN